MRRIALLPLKANSERVPGKNFKTLCGKPLFRWILDSLLALDTVSAVIINTDARKILQQHGLEESDRVMVRDRAQSLRGDLVSMNRIIEDDIAAVPADVYLMTHTTNPLLSTATISKALQRYIDRPSDRDSLFSVDRVQERFYREDGTAVNHDPNELVRTQDLEPWFAENSCLYVFSSDSFARTRARIGASPLMFETPRLESVDIDDLDDWIMAEALIQRLHKA